MDYDLVFVDDERNAVNDHRTQRPGARPWRPLPTRPSSGSRTVVVPQGSRPTVITGTASGYYQPPFQPAYYPGAPIAPSIASRFGMSTGELIDTGVQVLAAIMPLPVAPMAQGETQTDVENLMTFQGALATHAKRDEQLRTLGNLLVRILR
ncbi:MAG: hypothetical protein AB7T06_10910 [Kofleriaceae bacterium]